MTTTKPPERIWIERYDNNASRWFTYVCSYEVNHLRGTEYVHIDLLTAAEKKIEAKDFALKFSVRADLLTAAEARIATLSGLLQRMLDKSNPHHAAWCKPSRDGCDCGYERSPEEWLHNEVHAALAEKEGE